MTDLGPALNRLSPMRFVVAFGVVSCLADFVYEGARAIVGPFLANLGASALVVGFVTGAGEAVALVLRLGTGRLSDRTGRHWALSIAGYVVTVVAVPLLALAQTLWQAAVLVVAERFGKAVRTPARDTMLAQASSQTGRGWAFALHEALDQSGAVLGPLVVAGMVALGLSVRLVSGSTNGGVLFRAPPRDHHGVLKALSVGSRRGSSPGRSHSLSKGLEYLNVPRSEGWYPVRARTWKCGRHSGTGGSMPYSVLGRNPNRA